MQKENKFKRNLCIAAFSLAFIFLCLAVFITAKVNKDIKKATPEINTAPVYNIVNFHIITPGIIRGAQPSKKGLRILKDYCNVKTVLSLRGGEETVKWERGVVELLGMEFINIPMNVNKQGIEKIERCLNIMTDKSRQPVFIHCAAGKDRTGLIIAAYRIQYDNWSFEDALMEMLSYGYAPHFENLKASLRAWYDYVKSQTPE